MIDLTISAISGYVAIFWLTGYGLGKTWAFFKSILQRATGTY